MHTNDCRLSLGHRSDPFRFASIASRSLPATRRPAAWAAIFLFGVTLLQATVAPVPEFGVIFNDNQNFVVKKTISGTPTILTVAAATTIIENNVAALDAAGAGTLVRNVGYSTDIMYYPTTAGSNLGWRTLTPTEIAASTNSTWAQGAQDYMADAKTLIIDPAPANRLDPIRVQSEQAVARGLFYLLSYRMNDYDGLEDGALNAVAGEFRVNAFVTPTPPSTDDNPYLITQTGVDKYYDYDNATVRANRLALITEFIDRYQDTIDGVQLDFQRTNILFGTIPGTNVEMNPSASLMTDFVSAVRCRLNHWAGLNGRPYYLFVRVPPTVRDCHWVGLDLETWVANDLVDVISPAFFHDNSHSMPIGDFVALAEPHGVKVYPSFIRTGPGFTGSRKFVAAPGSSDSTAETVNTRTASVRAFAINSRAQGGTGVEMYNYNLPLTTIGEIALKTLLTCPVSGLKDKTYAVTPSRESLWRDTTSFPADPLPVQWSSTSVQTFHFPLHFQEWYPVPPPSRPTLEQPTYLGLRIAFQGVSSTDYITVTMQRGSETAISVYSGQASGSGTPAAVRTTVSGTQSSVPQKDSYLQIPLDGTKFQMKPGVYDVMIAVTPADAAQRKITEINLGVQYGL